MKIFLEIGRAQGIDIRQEDGGTELGCYARSPENGADESSYLSRCRRLIDDSEMRLQLRQLVFQVGSARICQVFNRGTARERCAPTRICGAGGQYVCRVLPQRRSDTHVDDQAMGTEANITLNGVVLGEQVSMIVRIAVMALSDITDNQLGFKDDGITLTVRYRADTQMILSMLRERRHQPKVN